MRSWTMRTFLVSLGVLTISQACALANTIEEGPAVAEKPPPRTDFGFDPASIPAPDRTRGTPIARVFDQYVYSDFALKSPAADKAAQRHLDAFIWLSLRKHFIEREQIGATKEEIWEYVRVMDEQMRDKESRRGVADFVIDTLLLHAQAAPMIEAWKFDRELYRRYGGIVTFQQFNPFEPVGAYRCFLEEAEAAKAIEFFDPKVRTRFLDPYFRNPTIDYLPEQVDFDKPWWLTKFGAGDMDE